MATSIIKEIPIIIGLENLLPVIYSTESQMSLKNKCIQRYLLQPLSVIAKDKTSTKCPSVEDWLCTYGMLFVNVRGLMCSSHHGLQ